MGHTSYEVTQDAVSENVAEARRFARSVMALWGLSGDAPTAALLISELVTNAIRHTPSSEVLVVASQLSAERVRLAVFDTASDRLPQQRPEEDDAESGRGLQLVDAFADRWGYDLLSFHPTRGSWGKTCWAELVVGEP
ncbi:ATP-binding protein [Streptomyces shenzhenensis]|uniref:ATP-binding protein n=1 Tax=Streptomyces shenzhenensis TaxID=943815 RepID=UPI003D8FE702